MKKLKWLGSSLKDVKKFPQKAKAEVGYQLHQIQCGFEADDWKPMKTIGQSVKEVRIHTDSEFRVIYTAKFEENIYVIHAFNKKTQKTNDLDISVAKKRFNNLVSWRIQNGYD